MLAVKCKNCGKRYDYREHGCCPECGAYNRPPRRNCVGVDGVVHRMTDADFLENSHKSRRSQGGKVCFEQDVCYEDQARKVRRGSEGVHIDRVAKQIEQAVTRRSTKKPPKKAGALAVVAVIAAILPALLTTCSTIGSEIIRPEPPVDYNDFGETVNNVCAMNDLFTWWGADAIITDFEVLHNGNLKEAVITAYRLTDTDQPLLYYSQRNVEWMDMTTYDYVTDLGNDYYSYHYFLPEDTVVGETDFMALCCGYEGDTYIETEIWLTLE